MILFIRHIPDNTKTTELKKFVEPALLRQFSFLPKHGKVVKAEILAIQNIHNKIVEHHGLVFLDTQEALQVALRKLRGKRFKNRSLHIREYKHRSLRNDRRRFAAANDLFEDQRSHDRRRGVDMLHVETLSTMSLIE